MNRFALAVAVAVPLSASAAKIMVFGGEGHAEYLGCFSCSEFESDSIWNKFGPFGNPFGQNLFNRFSPYRNPFSSFSMCSPYASDPPVLVDGDGNFYGRLTLNRFRSDRTSSEKINAWIAAVCAE